MTERVLTEKVKRFGFVFLRFAILFLLFALIAASGSKSVCFSSPDRQSRPGSRANLGLIGDRPLVGRNIERTFRIVVFRAAAPYLGMSILIKHDPVFAIHSCQTLL